MEALGTKGIGVPIGVPKALHKDIKEVNSEDKSPKNLFPNITGSVAFLSPNNISGDWITVFGESKLILLIEFKFILVAELSKIESLLELNNNLPEFRIICSPTKAFVDSGGDEYDL